MRIIFKVFWPAHLRLAFCAAGLLAIAAIYLSVASVLLVQERRESETVARVRLVTSLLAARIGNAVQLGIPLEKLAGIDEEFQEVSRKNREIVSVALVNRVGTILWSKERDSARGGEYILVPVRVDETEIAKLVVLLYSQQSQFIWAELIVLIGIVVVAFVLLSTEAARYALGLGPRFRDALVNRVAGEAALGHFSVLYVGGPRRSLDLRPQSILTAIRRLNEQHVRIRRLIDSLRHTEPSAPRRRILNHLLGQATGADNFASVLPKVIRLYPIESHVRWLVVLLGCCVGVLQVLWPATERQSAAWGVACGAVAAALGCLVASRIEKSIFQITLGSVFGIASSLVLNVFASSTATLIGARMLAWFGIGLILGVVKRGFGHQVLSEGNSSPQGIGLSTVALSTGIVGGCLLGPAFGQLSEHTLGVGPSSILAIVFPMLALAAMVRWLTDFGAWTLLNPRTSKGTCAEPTVIVACFFLGALAAFISVNAGAIYDQGMNWGAVFLAAYGIGVLAVMSYPRLSLRLALAVGAVGCLSLTVILGVGLSSPLMPIALTMSVVLTSGSLARLAMIKNTLPSPLAWLIFGLGALAQAFAFSERIPSPAIWAIPVALAVTGLAITRRG